jgi:alpha-N-arabinofuranosidase
MSKLHFAITPDNRIAEINPRLFGSFVEHLGRAVYTGIYEPTTEADAQGFRQDVINLVKEMNVTTVRYPGGNYVSGFNWRDGIGPKEERPVRLDYAWISKESNQFGISEFNHWCQQTHVEPMIAINLGTGTPQEAGYFIEYCNHLAAPRSAICACSTATPNPITLNSGASVTRWTARGKPGK